MDKLEKLRNGAFVVFFILVLYIFAYHYFKPPEDPIDADGDGNISNKELSEHIKKEIERRSRSPPGFAGVLRSAVSGAIRGACMGLILNGIEGAITSAIVLGMINPIITSIEYVY
jgi:hypothetical protein